VWNFVPPAGKATIEKSLEYYYRQYHGNDLKGLDEIKAQAALTTFPPGTLMIKPALTPAEIAHKVVMETPNLATLNLGDKEFILAKGVKEDADKLWTVLKDQVTPVPGIVIEANASVIKVAVTQDSKDAKVADFIVYMKHPLADNEIPVLGYVYGQQSKGDAELDGTYDTYTQVAATATSARAAQIVLRDGEVPGLESSAPEPTPEAVTPPPPPQSTPPQRQYDELAPPPTPPIPAPVVTIGERKAQVLTDFGEPQRKAVVGPKEIYFYTDLKMKVTFINGKVSSID